MGKTQKKPRQDIFGYKREVNRKERIQKQKRRENWQRYNRALSYTEPVECRCARCGSRQTDRIETRTINLLGSQAIGWCDRCKGWRLMNISDRKPCPAQQARKEIIAACKSIGLRYRIENQYAVLTGKTRRWYIDWSSVHKNAFCCGKHCRVWGKNTDYSSFYTKRKVSAVDAILEIGALERMDAEQGQMTEQLRDSIRRERITRICGENGFVQSFREPFACIKTDISEWRFDYHKDRVTLLHKNDAPVLDEITGAVMDYHVQFANYDLTVEQVIDGIADHEKWKKEHPD